MCLCVSFCQFHATPQLPKYEEHLHREKARKAQDYHFFVEKIAKGRRELFFWVDIDIVG